MTTARRRREEDRPAGPTSIVRGIVAKGASRRRTARSRPGVEGLESRQLLAGAAAGTLDPGFGAGSGSVFGFESDQIGRFFSDTADGVAVQADGRIVIAGGTTEVVAATQAFQQALTVVRLDPDGMPDPTFGTGGRVVLATEPGQVGNVRASSVLIRPDGKIVVVGQDAPSFSATRREVVFRLNADGSRDSTFGVGGEVAFSSALYPQFPQSASAALAADGKILLGGLAAGPNQTGSPVAAARLDADGSLDTTFNGTGMTSTPLVINGLSNNVIQAVAIQADGKFILAGYGESGVTGRFPFSLQVYHEAIAVRFNADGSLDTAFGGPSAAGKLLIAPDPAHPARLGQSTAMGVAIQADGKIVLGGGGFDADSIVTRLDAGGSFDPTFGVGGQARVPAAYGGVDVGLVIQRDGKIVLAGESFHGISEARLARFNADGTLDAGFGNTAAPGVFATTIGNKTTNPSAVALQPDGRIVMVGHVMVPTGNPSSIAPNLFAAIRVLGSRAIPASAQPPANYDGSGRTDLAVYLPSIAGFAYRPTAGGADVFVPFGIAGPGQTLPAPGDYTGAGRTEIAAYLPAYGLYAIRPAGGGPDVVVPFGTAGAGRSIPTPGDYEGTGRSDIAVYLPSIGAFGIRPADGGPDKIIPFGIAGAGGSIPAPADYFGTGRSDIAVYLPSIGAFAIRPPGGGADKIIPFGIAGAGGSIPVPGDYDGSGKTELAVYMPSLGLFAYRPARGGPDVLVPFGTPGVGSIPVPGDYSGSGRAELAVFDPHDALFAYRPASGSDVLTVFGSAGVGASLPAAAPPGSVAAPGVVHARSVGPASAVAPKVGAAVPAGRAALAASLRRAGLGPVAQDLAWRGPIARSAGIGPESLR